jgi:hypothetical protein
MGQRAAALVPEKEKQEDDRDRNADKPKKRAFAKSHGGSPVSRHCITQQLHLSSTREPKLRLNVFFLDNWRDMMRWEYLLVEFGSSPAMSALKATLDAHGRDG